MLASLGHLLHHGGHGWVLVHFLLAECSPVLSLQGPFADLRSLVEHGSCWHVLNRYSNDQMPRKERFMIVQVELLRMIRVAVLQAMLAAA